MFIESLFEFANPFVLQWSFLQILDKPKAYRKRAACGLAKAGHLRFLTQLLYSCDREDIGAICQNAAAGGHMQILYWLKKNKYYPHLYWKHDICIFAAKHGHLEPFVWLNSKYYDSRVFLAAAKQGHVHILEWFLSIGVKLPSNIWDYVVRIGNLETVKHVVENGHSLSRRAMGLAARKGHLEIVKYLCSIYTKYLGAFVCSMAAEGGHLNVLQWLRESGCNWDSETTQCALERGNLEILKWATENGCPIRSTASETASRYGNLHILKWLYDSGYIKLNIECMKSAIRGGHWEIIHWLIGNGIKPDSACADVAIRAHKTEIFMYFVENGYPWNEKECMATANWCNKNVQMWLNKYFQNK